MFILPHEENESEQMGMKRKSKNEDATYPS